MALLVLLIVCAIVPAAASADYDNLPGEPLGADAPYGSAAVFAATTPTFDTEHFDLQSQERNQKSAYTACAEPKGSKDAWVRFDAGVAGNVVVAVSKDTPGTLFYKVYTAPSANPQFSELHEIGCESQLTGNYQSYVWGYPVPARSEVFVQVLMECHVGNVCEEAEENAAEGGNTSVSLRFTPDDADGDAFPDTLDLCPSVAGAYHGCPDSDGDGVGDPEDACPGVKGKPPTGCPLPDEDGDGYASIAAGGTDCNDQNPAINPGAPDIPGDRIDQNCDGHDAAYPVLHNEIGHELAYSRRRHRTVGFLKPFKIGGPLVPGMVARLTCSGRGCPYSREAVSVHEAQPGGLVIGKRLVNQILAPGASVTVSVTRPEYVGEAIRFTTRKHGKMLVEELCVPVGSGTPESKCELTPTRIAIWLVAGVAIGAGAFLIGHAGSSQAESPSPRAADGPRRMALPGLTAVAPLPSMKASPHHKPKPTETEATVEAESVTEEVGGGEATSEYEGYEPQVEETVEPSAESSARSSGGESSPPPAATPEAHETPTEKAPAGGGGEELVGES